jgi:hypothetical protein
MSASEPTLKCVIAWSDRRNLCSIVVEALQAKIDAGGVLRLSEDALIIHIANDPAEIRLGAPSRTANRCSSSSSNAGPGMETAWTPSG